jgi:predicted secreted protein
MNRLKYAIFLVSILMIGVISCKKDNNSKPTIQLTSADSGKALAVAQGQKISITLANPGDGGFNFNTWQYDSSVLQLNSHTHIPPANPDLIGNYGTDVWVFTTLKSGTTTLSISATRTSAEVVSMFADTVKVQ